MSEGSLTVVGTGYMGAGHVTPEALAHIDAAGKLFYLGGDPATRRWLEGRNPTSESLYDAYRVGGDRRSAYAEMVERILEPVTRGLRVCAAFYGHPGVFVYPSHEAIRRARAAGYPASMLPAVSAEDCLFADLGVDPARAGCQSYEASYFLVRRPRFSTSSALVLWQVGAVGVATYERKALWGEEGLRILVDTLLGHYPSDHEVVVYEASMFPVCEPSIERVPLARVPRAKVTVHSTIYVPPLEQPPPDPAMMARLSLATPQPRRAEARVREVARTRNFAGASRSRRRTHAGSLTVVGTGYSVAGQITAEAKAHIEQADRIFYLLREPFTATYVRELNRRATSLHDCYWEGRSGAEACEEMVERIVGAVRHGAQVCAVFYGHPAILAGPGHEAIRQTRALGYEAQMLPAVSIADCLFADLGVDPGTRGCQLYEATDFLLHGRTVEDATPLILLQVGAVGTTAYHRHFEGDRESFAVLVERLRALYPDDHPVTVYEIPMVPTHDARMETVPLSRVGDAALTVYSTLYVPPAREPALSEEMLHRLKLEALLRPPSRSPPRRSAISARVS